MKKIIYLILLLLFTSCVSDAYAYEDEENSGISPPKHLEVLEVQSNHIAISWTGEFPEYEIHRTKSLSEIFKLVDYSDRNKYYDYDLEENTDYYYKLKGIKSGGLKSEFSVVIKVRTLENVLVSD